MHKQTLISHWAALWRPIVSVLCVVCEGWGGVQTTWTSPLHACAGPDCHLHQILSERPLPSNCNLEAKTHRLLRETLLNLNLLPVFQSTSCSCIQENRKDVHAFLTGCSRLLPPLDMRNHDRKWVCVWVEVEVERGVLSAEKAAHPPPCLYSHSMYCCSWIKSTGLSSFTSGFVGVDMVPVSALTACLQEKQWDIDIEEKEGGCTLACFFC